MPNTQVIIHSGHVYAPTHNVRVDGGNLRDHGQYIDGSAVFANTLSAMTLSGSQVFGLLDCTSRLTSTNFTLPSAAQVLPYLQHIRTGASWEFRVASAVTGLTTTVIAGTGWDISGSGPSAANFTRVTGQMMTMTCWVTNLTPGSETIKARVSWAF